MSGADFRFTPLEKPFIKGWGYCEKMHNSTMCREYTPNQYKRVKQELSDWNPLMPIYLCEDCAGDRIPYSIEEANKIADQIKSEFLQKAC